MDNNFDNAAPAPLPSVELPAWYQSSAGPGLSSTLINLAGNIIPVVNFFIASQGINILPANVNALITTAVFVFFSIRAGIGYVRAKKVLGMQVGYLQKTLDNIQAKANK